MYIMYTIGSEEVLYVVEILFSYYCNNNNLNTYIKQNKVIKTLVIICG